MRIVDSGSSEAELAAMRQFDVQLSQIQPEQFGHGRTRNLLASEAHGEVLVFLTQDAEPASDCWIEKLIAPLADERVAGTYSRQLPRPDADPLIRYFLFRTYGPTPARRMPRPARPSINEIFFSNVGSAIRASVWREIPFRSDLVMSEDQYWANDALQAGYELAYQPTAGVYHSHAYSLQSVFRRNWLSGASLRDLIADGKLDIAVRGLKYLIGEAAFLAKHGAGCWLPYMLAFEASKSLGFGLGLRFSRSRQVGSSIAPACNRAQ